MSAQASRPAAAGVHRAAEAVDGYYENPRPELVELVPAHARVIVDVGCGQGALGGAIRRERGAWVLGLELVPEAIEVARGRLDRVERVDLDAVEELPVAIGSVDAFLCGDVLEHLRDPERLLGVLRRYLAPGGVVIASIPNVKHWSVLAPLLLEDRFTYTQAGLLDRTHVHLFTLEEISAMLDRVGLEGCHLDAIRFALPPELRPIGELVAHWGGDVAETIARLEAYQYLVVARSTEGGA
jgi:2-polyprenyl-3-methyl-5-hydroxy-6-metoxy-1,4-benzoquinol methylase